MAAATATDPRFRCGGQVETETWSLWDRQMAGFMQKRLLQDRLFKDGDVYALYDLQIYTHNLVAMARRCNRQDRLLEISRLVRAAYDALELGPVSSPGRRWICHGGAICNRENGLAGTEVMLDSAQFLALAASVANGLASSGAALDDEAGSFIAETARIVIEHLQRWGNGAAIARLKRLAAASPGDVRDGSSALFFNSDDLWLVAIYAELAGVLESGMKETAASQALPAVRKRQLRRHLLALMDLFSKRLTLRQAGNAGEETVTLADIDRGYWRLYRDNAYAGYEQKEKPVACAPAQDGQRASPPQVRIPADAVPRRQDIGWDISHARELVPALDALERNRAAIARVFSVAEAQLPPPRLAPAFAATLARVVWNGDPRAPLFSNYFSGANGWYRVAYDNGTGDCVEGHPPYSLSDSFPTGGYVAWARYEPVIGLLGARLYALLAERGGEDARFIATYYASLGSEASPEERELATLMFFPSLVQAGNDGAGGAKPGRNGLRN